MTEECPEPRMVGLKWCDEANTTHRWRMGQCVYCGKKIPKRNRGCSTLDPA